MPDLSKFAGLLAILVVMVLTPVSVSANEPGNLLPSEAIVLMLNKAMKNPELTRQDVFEDLLPRVITEGLDERETFLLGEVYFFSLDAGSARDAFWQVRSGNSMIARVAWKRIIQIRFRAFQMFEQAASDMERFRERFPAVPEDRGYLGGQVRNFGMLYRDSGEHEKVVQVVEAELAALNNDGAYDSFIYPAFFIDSYTSVGKRGVALSHLKKARDGLSETLRTRERNPPEEDYAYPLPSDNYAFLYSPATDRLGWSQENRAFRKLIAALSESIASIESGRP